MVCRARLALRRRGVEAVAGGAAGGCGDGGGSGEGRERCFGAEPAWVGPGDQELGGADGADPGLGGQGRLPGADQGAEVVVGGGQAGVVGGDLGGELAQGMTQVLFADWLAG